MPARLIIFNVVVVAVFARFSCFNFYFVFAILPICIRIKHFLYHRPSRHIVTMLEFGVPFTCPHSHSIVVVVVAVFHYMLAQAI